MSRISEFEPRRRSDDDREEARYGRKARRSWPASAWFVAITMIALNLGLGAFLVKNELDRGASGGNHGRRGGVGEAAPTFKSAWPTAESPKVEARPDAQASQSPLPAQTSTQEVSARDTAKTDDQNSGSRNREVPIVPLKAGPAQTRPAHTPAAEGRRWATVPTMRREPVRHYITEPLPQASYSTPQVPAVTVPTPASTAIAVVPPPAVVASARTPTVGARSQTEPSQKVIGPAAGSAAKKPQPALDPTAGQNLKQPIRVASVDLPGMEKGIVIPKTPVGSPSPKIEIVRRPAGPKVDIPNCGGDVVVPCPTLKKRQAGGAPEGDRW